MITLDRLQWSKIAALIVEEYKETPSVYMLRSKMKRVLGFTIREEPQWKSDVIYLDFFDDQKKTIFILKYM
jgi:hypothetical protein